MIKVGTRSLEVEASQWFPTRVSMIVRRLVSVLAVDGTQIMDHGRFASSGMTCIRQQPEEHEVLKDCSFVVKLYIRYFCSVLVKYVEPRSNRECVFLVQAKWVRRRPLLVTSSAPRWRSRSVEEVVLCCWGEVTREASAGGPT